MLMKLVHSAPKKRAAPRKTALDWRCISRASKIKDGRPVMLAFPDPKRQDEFLVEECYWHLPSKTWFLSHTSPELNFDAVTDLYGEPEFWLPKPKLTKAGAHKARDAFRDTVSRVLEVPSGRHKGTVKKEPKAKAGKRVKAVSEETHAMA